MKHRPIKFHSHEIFNVASDSRGCITQFAFYDHDIRIRNQLPKDTIDDLGKLCNYIGRRFPIALQYGTRWKCKKMMLAYMPFKINCGCYQCDKCYGRAFHFVR